MSPESAREILLIRSLESSDRDGSVIPLKARVQSTKELGITPRGDELNQGAPLAPMENTRLIERSRKWIGELERQADDAAAFASHGSGERGKWSLVVAGVLVSAFVLGAASNYLGSGAVVNLLAFPLFGLIAWNLAMYLVMLVSAVLARRGRQENTPMQKLAGWLRKGMDSRLTALGEPFRAAAARFNDEWFELSAPAQWRAIRMVAHLGAMFLAGGVLAGMYLRGLGYEYKAGWESTFLNAEAVESWLRILLGPGSSLTGIGIPPGKMTIAQLDLAVGSGEKADQWIHLFAANTALYIFVPRLLFVVWELVGLSRWRSELAKTPLFAGYYDKLATTISGGGQLVRVLPFHCTPDPRHRDTVRGLIHQLWGGASHVDFAKPAAYGEEEQLLEGMPKLPGYIVLMMSLSATPEGEVHGFLIGELQKRMRASDEEARLLLLLDENRFRERFGKLPEFARRLEERHAAWEELVKPFGIEIGYFNSDDSETAERLAKHGDQLVWSSIGSSA